MPTKQQIIEDGKVKELQDKFGLSKEEAERTVTIINAMAGYRVDIPNNIKQIIEEEVENLINNIYRIARFSADGEKILRDYLSASFHRIFTQAIEMAIGEVGAKLLAKHSPQAVLDAYFDAANKVMEKYEINH